MRWLAQRAVTGEWLHTDLPLIVDEVGYALSAPGHVTASVDPAVGQLLAEDRRLLLDEWGTILWAEDGGVFRWGGLVALSRPGESGRWEVEAAGFGAYPHSRVYRGTYSQAGVDPTDVIKHIWDHVQQAPRGDLGVQVKGDSSPVRIGERGHMLRDGRTYQWVVPHTEFQRMYEADVYSPSPVIADTPDELLGWLYDHAGYADQGNGRAARVGPWRTATDQEFSETEAELMGAGWGGGPISTTDISTTLASTLRAGGWASRDGYLDAWLWPPAMNGRTMIDGDVLVPPLPYRLRGWAAVNCGKEIDDLVNRAGVEWVERYELDGEQPVPVISLGYPRVGRIRRDLMFAEDENVTAVDYSSSLSDEHANTVIGLGESRGARTVRRERSVDDGRVARDHVLERPTDYAAMLARDTQAALAWRSSPGVQIKSVTVRDHPHARIGSWEVGDDIRVRLDVPGVGEVEAWVRITAWTRRDADAVLTVQRSDAFHHGGVS